MSDLPPFPVDNGTLDMLMMALEPGPDAERTSLDELLTLMSEMGGSDTEAVASVEVMPHPFAPGESIEAQVMRDPCYHPNDVICALIAALRAERERLAHNVAPEWRLCQCGHVALDHDQGDDVCLFGNCQCAGWCKP